MDNVETDLASESIAIIGMAGRFPGAESVESFWQNLKDGVESVTHFSVEDLAAKGIDRALLQNPDYIRARAVLQDVAEFDAPFFGFQPREAEVMDPQHRLFLECSWEALESAGYDSETYEGSIGVYGGSSLNTYLLFNLCANRRFNEDLARSYQVGDFQTLTGNDKDYLPTRVSYKLNLKGPSVSIQSACSTSLVAICQACSSLLSYQCDMALAGGVSIAFPQERGYLYQEGAMVSPDGHCRAFDADAQGTVFGGAVGIVVLKRLSEALADGDHIHAIIKGAAINNDGAAKVSYSAPSVDGQAEVIEAAHALAGVSADSITYVEAHGTGTPLGDPIEVAALTKAFRSSTDRTGYCAIGSVKTNIGHVEAAAGVTGLIKTVLALENEMLPPTLHYRRPNPRIDFAGSPFYVNGGLAEWKAGGAPRRAGVSSFGVGGTNAHVVLEEAPVAERSGPSRPCQLILLSAKTKTALDRATANLAAHLRQHPDVDLADTAYTLQVGRRAFGHRRMLVCRNLSEAIDLLETPGANRVLSRSPEQANPPVVFMFPGQGAQHVNMGLELYRSEPCFKEQIDRCCRLLEPLMGLDLRDVLYPSPEQSEAADQKLKQTWITQPALFVVEYALAHLWMEWGVSPQAMIGHSLGEYVAACLAGTLDLDDALMLLVARARLMQQLPAGSMLAVRLPEEEIRPLLGSTLALAALNAPGLCTVSGPTDAITELERQLEERGVACRLLQTSHAFHSEMMDPILDQFAAIVKRVILKAPRIPYISNLTGTWITAADATDPGYWCRHLRETVHFSEGVRNLLQDSGRVALEIGPGQVLSALARQHLSKADEFRVISSLQHEKSQLSGEISILNALGRLWIAGVKVNWQGFYTYERRQRVVLPTYPFERKSYWVEPVYGGDPEAKAIKADLEITVDPTIDRGSMTVQGHDNPMNGTKSNGEIPAPEVEASRRPDRIVSELKLILNEMSGIELTEIDPEMTFLDMGLDSLFLTQLASAYQGKYKVKVTFRHLLEDLPTLDALAQYIDQKLPPDAAPAPVLPQRAAPLHVAPDPSTAAPIPSIAVEAPMTASATALERVVQQQLQVMAQQLEAMRGLPASAGRMSVVPGDSPPARPQMQPGEDPTDRNQTAPTPAVVSEAPAGDTRQHGPFKPIQKTADGSLTARQQAHLNELIARYTRRTPESKRQTQLHRSHLSDPRAVAGFRPYWKEMVYPIVATRSSGSRIWDVDENEYIDVTMGFGVNLFGHSPDFITEAVERQLKLGVEIGPQSPLAGRVAQMVCELTGMERAALCNTGSEAVMVAMRLARTVTGRNKIAMFTGDYHGTFDEVLVRANNIKGRLRTVPIAPGIPAGSVENVLVLDYGAPESLEILKANAHELAAVLVEPVQSRHPDLQPREFLHEVRRITAEAEIALIFDEVITGFRCHTGGAQAWFGIEADLATYGKIIGGGMPIGVVTGKATYMDALDGGMWNYGDASFPEVGVTFFAGTFVRHPLALAAAVVVLECLKSQGQELLDQLNQRSERFAETLNRSFERSQTPIRAVHFGSIFYLSFAPELKWASLLFYHMREKGVHIWEGRPFFLSTAHTDEDIAFMIRAFEESVAEMRDGGFLPDAPGAPDPGSSGRAKEAPDSAAAATLTVDVFSGQSVTSAKYSDVKILPLTEPQQEIFLASQMGDSASCAFNESLTLEMHGPLQVTALQDAWRLLTDRHEALRTTFSADGEHQIIAPERPIEIPLVDLSGLPEAERAMRVDALTRSEGELPFDLINGPLLRVQLVQLAAQHHLCVLTAHHVICDGWSFGIVLNELGAIYSAFADGTKPALDTPVSFGEYTRRQIARHDNGEASSSEAYWLKQLDGTLPVLELPTDRPRPSVMSYRGAREVIRLGRDQLTAIKKIGAKNGCTAFTTLFAGYNLWLRRLTGSEDLIIGVPCAGQSLEDASDLVGHCVNTLPIRLKVENDPTLKDYLAATRAAIYDAFDHQDCTFGTLLQQLPVTRGASRAPLISAIFNLDRPLTGLKFQCLQVELKNNPRSHYQFDLGFNIVDEVQSLCVECDYNSDLFDAATIRRWLDCFVTLMAGMVEADAGVAISRLPLLPEVERHNLLDSVATRHTHALDAPLHQLVAEQARLTPDRPAILFAEQTLTYRQLNEQSNQLAHRLQEMGIGSEGRIGLCLLRSPQQMIAVLAVLKAGAAYIPLDPAYPAERLSFMAEDAGLQVLITDTSLLPRLPALDLPTICLDAEAESLRQLCASDLPAEPVTDRLVYVTYTSGSTGRPKGILMTQRPLLNLLAWMLRTTRLPEGARTLQFASLSFDVSFQDIFSTWCSGGTLVLITEAQRQDIGGLWSEIVTRGVHRLFMPAVALQQLAEAFRPGEHCGANLLKVISGSEQLMVSPALIRMFECLPACRLHNEYGPSETHVVSECMLPVDPVAWPQRPTIGRPIDNTQLYVLDRWGQLAPLGVSGEIYIGGAGLARGYNNRPEAESERFVPSPFVDSAGQRLYRTGDLGRWRLDGDLEFLGRVDHQVKIRGYRIEPGEIETVLEQHPGVGEAVVLARDYGAGDRRLIAYVGIAGDQTPTVTDLRAYMGEKLPEYMTPSSYVLLPKLPLNANGKVDRKALPDPDTITAERENELVLPRDDFEARLVTIWEQVLSARQVGIRDDFFALGGHSLLAVRLFVRIEEQFGRRLPLALLFQAPTVERLAEHLRGGPAPIAPVDTVGTREIDLPESDAVALASVPPSSASPVNLPKRVSVRPAVMPSLAPIRAGGSRPPLFCVHPIHGSVLCYRDMAFNLSQEQPVYGLQAQGLAGEQYADASIEEMASRYIDAICEAYPDGPYCLAGYSLGGIIAYEMSQQLRARGRQVPLIALFDTYAPSYFQKEMIEAKKPLAHRIAYHVKVICGLDMRGRLLYIRERARGIRKGVEQRMVRKRREQAPAQDSLLNSIEHLKHVNELAVQHYNPAAALGPVTLFRAQEQEVLVNSEYDPRLFWGDVITEQLEIHEVRGDHWTMIEEPFVRDLASAVQSCLNRVNGEKALSIRQV